MSFDAKIKNHFNKYGFELTNGTGPFVFQIKNSMHLPMSKAIEIIKADNYCPILSQNRISANLEFTVVPYNKPRIFENLTCARKKMNEDELWDSIESTTHLYKEGIPFIIQGKQLPYSSTTEAKNEMLQNCTQANSFVVEFLDQAPTKGNVLDLGCGLGSNSVLFLKKGWNVVAIDNSSLVIDIFQKKIQTENSKYIENEQLIIVNSDISEIDFNAKKFDLVICIDVLPYINSKKLKSVINKIYNSLLPNGQFIGTLFFNPPKGPNTLVEYLNKLGAHFYEGSHIVPALLENSGFHVDECQIRIDPLDYEPIVAQFIATKK